MTLHRYIGRSRHRVISLGALFIFAACSGSEPPVVERAAGGSSTAAPPAAATDSSARDTVNPMAGMDHSKMPGMGRSSTAPPSNPMPGMDHSKMPGMARGNAPTPPAPMTGMDHSKMQMNPPTARPSPAMDHSTMGGTAGAENAADRKLQQIVARLVQDSVVLKRIEADSVLRARWLDPVIQRIFLGLPGR